MDQHRRTGLLNVIISAAAVLFASGCGTGTPQVEVEVENTKTTRDFLLAHQFRPNAPDSTRFVLANTRLGDAAKNLGFEISSLRPTPGQSAHSDVRIVKIRDRYFLVESQVRDTNGEVVTGSLDDPNALCNISVTYSETNPAILKYQWTASRPTLRIKNVSTAADKPHPLIITVELATNGDMPAALATWQFSFDLQHDGKRIQIGEPIFAEETPKVFTAFPEEPVILTLATSGKWSDLPPGQYQLAVGFHSNKWQEFSFQWLGSGCSEYVTVER